jgi:hypothetical protein
VELNTTYWIIALYSLARSSFSPLIISSLVEDDAAPASAAEVLLPFDMGLYVYLSLFNSYDMREQQNYHNEKYL